MKDPIFIEWESIGEDTARLRVFGGWLVRTIRSNKNWISGSGDQYSSSMGIAFIADPKHEWKIGDTGCGYGKYFVLNDEPKKESNA